MQPQTTPRPTPVPPTGCCPPFDPGPWDDKEIVWRDRLFVKDHVHTFMHVPLDMGRKVTQNQAKIDAAGAAPAQGLMLTEETSAFGLDILIDVTAPVPGATMVALSGTYYTKVFDGPYRDAGRWIADVQHRVAARGRAIEKIYLAYTTCPSCAKAYGHNYVIVFAKLREPGDAGPN
jgi:hypothetical protein